MKSHTLYDEEDLDHDSQMAMGSLRNATDAEIAETWTSIQNGGLQALKETDFVNGFPVATWIELVRMAKEQRLQDPGMHGPEGKLATNVCPNCGKRGGHNLGVRPDDILCGGCTVIF